MILAKQKDKLINRLIAEGYLKTDAVIKAFRKVPRELFVPDEYKEYSYVDEPLPIAEGQTISQPLTVAVMTEELDIKPRQKILEIGTGSGYQTALLAEVVGETGKIVTVERIPKLAGEAKARLEKLGYKNIEFVTGDGTLGYKKREPYDRIIATASAPDVPESLKMQLKTDGIMVLPVGSFVQNMIKIIKTPYGYEKHNLGFFQFVPMIGEEGFK